MRNASSIMSSECNSPKTPGGISKSLLTPCRRVGLSRNWKRQGPSPFISPLASSGEEKSLKEQIVKTRKRKENEINTSPGTSNSVRSSEDVNRTPSREVEVPRKKKSKTLVSIINKSQEDLDVDSEAIDNADEEAISNVENFKKVEAISTTSPVRSNFKCKKKVLDKSISIVSSEGPSSSSSFHNEITLNNDLETDSIAVNDDKPLITPKVPNKLATECIIVLQKKLFKKDFEKQINNIQNLTPEEKVNSQTLFDSDSDNEPLINKKEHKRTSDDEDFKPSIIKRTNSKIMKQKSKSPACKVTKSIKLNNNKNEDNPSQNSFDDDDFEPKKTILVRKTYEKIKKPVKAKSTGSITQRDIDELKARIENKKKILLTKAMIEDTKELRDLIKKWQKGCQDALMQLMDLMKLKLADKSMDYSQMLEMLQIPANLVGYDEENDCFNTPSDINIILSNI